MTNYEKAMELLKQERAEKHRTFDDTGIICITTDRWNYDCRNYGIFRFCKCTQEPENGLSTFTETYKN